MSHLLGSSASPAASPARRLPPSRQRTAAAALPSSRTDGAGGLRSDQRFAPQDAAAAVPSPQRRRMPPLADRLDLAAAWCLAHPAGPPPPAAAPPAAPEPPLPLAACLTSSASMAAHEDELLLMAWCQPLGNDAPPPTRRPAALPERPGTPAAAAPSPSPSASSASRPRRARRGALGWQGSTASVLAMLRRQRRPPLQAPADEPGSPLLAALRNMYGAPPPLPAPPPPGVR